MSSGQCTSPSCICQSPNHLCQQHGLQHIAYGVRHADDVTAHGGRLSLDDLPNHLEAFHNPPAPFRATRRRVATGRADFPVRRRGRSIFFGFVEAGVLVVYVCGAQDSRYGLLVYAAVLSYVERRHMKSERARPDENAL